MKFVSSTLTALCVSFVSAAAVVKTTSNSWAGSNLYFLHGLSPSDQTAYVDTLADYGAKVVRIWVTGLSSGCQKGSNVAVNIPDLEPKTIGVFDDTVLQALDSVLAKFVQKGIKAIISPHDGNAWGYNSCDVYCRAYGSGTINDQSANNFYQSTTAKAQYDNRMAHVLNYVSPSSGKPWGQWSDAILAFDVQNEPFQQGASLASQNDPSNWLCGRAVHMKQVMGNSTVKLATGGIGGDQSHGYNFMAKAVECDAIDIMSIHSYVGTANFWTSFLPTSKKTAASKGKLIHVEEWGVTTSYQDGFDAQAAAIVAQGIPFTYWQMIPGSDGSESCTSGCCKSYDGFEIGLHSGKGNLQQALQAAESHPAAQDWSDLVD